MKKIVLLIFCFCVINHTFSQKKKDTLPPYLQVKIIPPFKLYKTNDTAFEKKDIPEKKSVVIMYFDPECSHCQMFTKDLTDSIHLLKNTFVVMAAYKKIDLLKQFEKQYQLNKFDNIVVGRDYKYVIPGFYKIKIIPFIALYNKKGNLIDVFRNGTSVKNIHELIQ